MVIVQGVFEVEPDERAHFLDARLDAIRNTRVEDGCLEYALAADPIDAGRVIISERWESMDHLRRHLDASPARSADREPLPQPLSAGITVYEISASQRLR
jgi:quinol monooxygenase YgiN